MVRRCPPWSGVSRTASTSRRFSLSTTSAARDNSDEVTPLAISLIVRIEQGATIMPMVGNEPDEIAAPISLTIINAGQRADILGLEVGLINQRHFRRFAHDQMGLDLGHAQHLEQPHAIDGTGRAGYADNQACGCGHAEICP